MSKKLAWGILGTGTIARTFASAVERSATGRLVAVAGRTRSKAEQFAEEVGVPHAHDSYDALLENPEVQAVYIATPHSSHAQWAIRAAEAKKHLLVEKPLALNHPQAMAIVEAAVENDVFLMEAFMYRCAPQTHKLLELLRENVIGEVRLINATFSFNAQPRDPDSRLLSNALAGGGILDVGCYCVSMARFIAGAEPVEIKAVGHLGDTGVDEWTCALLRFPGNVLAQLSTGVQLQQENVVRIYGSEGSILIPEPWVPAKHGGTTRIIVHRAGERQPRDIVVESTRHLYAIEADTVATSIAQRQAPSPAMTPQDSLNNMKVLDAWRAQIGLVYDAEKPESFPSQTVAGRTLVPNCKPTIPQARIEGLDKPVSRLVMGTDNQNTLPHAAVMFDDFVERGGNVFDTAHIYGSGRQERILGQWMQNRRTRDQVVVIVKGGHTPYCTPEHLTAQLFESLERLQTDHADIYMLHRDNLDVPVGEFIDVLNEHVQAGRIRIFGGSNWTLDRLGQANEYARSGNLQPMRVVSNQFSLARMIDPVWTGCVSATDPEFRAFLTQSQITLLAWSSQARGFFVPGRAHPQKLDDPQLARSFYSDDNFARLARATELAQKKGVSPINIALAYVIDQPFPTFALIGPRALSETHTSLPALKLQLSAEELRWLNLEI